MRLWVIIIQVILLFDSVYDSSGIVAPSKLSVQQSYSAHGSFVERGSLGAEEGVVVDSAEFRKLIVEDDLYRLKISNGKQSIVASVRACDLYKAGFKEKIVLHTDAHQEYVVGVDYSPSHGVVSRKTTCQADKLNLPNGKILVRTTVKITPAVPAQVIPVQVEGPPPPGIKIINPDIKENPAEHQSFLIKYWYIFIPLVIMTFLGGGAPADKQGQGGGNTQSAGTSA